MKYAFFLMAASIGLLVACSEIEKDFTDGNSLTEGDLVEKVIFEVLPVKDGDDSETKASAVPNGGTVGFVWEATDTVGIYPGRGSQVYFNIEDGVGTSSVSFTGGGWALKQNSTYTSYYPFVGDIYLKRDKIPVSFAGQKQIGTTSPFVGARYYLATGASTSENGVLRFSYSTLNTIINVNATLPAGTYTKMSLTTEEPLFVEEGTYSLDDHVIVGTKFTNTLEIDLEDIVLTGDGTIPIYIMSAPVDLKGKKITVRITTANGSSYKCIKTPTKEYLAGTRYGLTCDEMEREGQLVPEAIDLGLSVKWASFNLGATKPEEYGDYYAWGETETKTNFNWENYKYRISGYQSNDVQLSKYNTDPSRGTVDYKTILEPSDDIAHVTLGGSWRLPTGLEYNELSNSENCDWEWTILNGVNGYRITSKKQGFEGNSIFLPASGTWNSLSATEVGVNGYYWCCVLSPLSVLFAEEMHFSSSHYLMNSSDRCRGFPVRPVYGDIIPISDVTVSKSELELEVGESEMLLAQILPENASSKHYIWTSSNESVAIVNKPEVVANGGIVTGLGEGTAIITVSATDGSEASASCTVTVLSVPETKNPLTFTSTGTSSISLTKEGYPNAVSIRYKIDDKPWTRYSVGDIITLNDGEQVSFRAGATGNESLGKSLDDFYRFSMTGSGAVAASGNIMSILGSDEPTAIYSPLCFYKLFDGCTLLTSAPELPATTLSNSCYYFMFQGCTNLTTAPELPATTMVDYCYGGMFRDCTSLTTAPELPATSLARSCYSGMFSGCTSLTTAPDLPSTTLADYSYASMFSYCSSLATAPVLPATSLEAGCYDYMFEGCTSLITAPTLPATTLEYRCYAGMFWGCSNLTTAPELPATTLVSECYMDMFGGCSKLTTAPVLPAYSLEKDCYTNMFHNCTKLNYVKALFISSPYFTIKDWLFGVSSTGTFVKNIDAKWDNRDGIPSGWTVITFTPDFVDLGLSVKWARYNLCESGLCANPEDSGDYYAWGETEPYYTRPTPWFSWKDGKSEGYRWVSYTWCDGSDRTLTKYNPNSSYGTVDNKTVLEEADDVAHVKLGGSWRMPTGEEWNELLFDCTWTWVTNYNGSGINGSLVTATNGNSIFLPAAGSLSGTNVHYENDFGNYWSSSLDTSIPYRALGEHFGSNGGYVSVSGGDDRYIGRSVRPVCN